MRIAYFTDMFLPQISGVATSIANQATQLGKEGHSILIFTPKLDDIKRSKFKAKNVTVVHLPTVPVPVYTEFKLGVLGLPKVIKYLTKFKPDLIHLHSVFTIGMDGVMAAKILKIPLVGTVHMYFVNSSDYLRFIKYTLVVKLLGKVSKLYLNFLYNQCDLVLAPSKMLVKELNSNGFKKTVHYQPNGIILERAKLLSEKDKVLLKKKYGLREKIVLHFGRLSYEKNVDLLIKAFHIITKNHSNISLFIIGDGPAKKDLSKLTKKLGIEKNVIFTGFMDHQLLLSSGILSIGDVFATASTMENNPMAVLEAMFYKLPIIGVKQAGLIELISSNGFLVKAGDINELAEKIKKVLFDEKLKLSMGERSKEIVKQYAIDKSTARLLNFYHNLLYKTRS